MASNMAAELSLAVGVVAELAEHEQAIMACYTELAQRASDVAIQRMLQNRKCCAITT
jgi:hypothetical protein